MREHLNSLTGLRGLAAISVFLAHAEIGKYFSALGNYSAFFKWHNGAVDLFFVLSGFTLAYVYVQDGSRKVNYRDYALARFARIFPLYFVAFAAATLLVIPTLSIKYRFSAFAPDFILQLLMVNAWPLVGNSTFFNVPSWSISIEIFCYIIVFPLMVAIYRKETHNTGFATLAGIVLMSASFLLYKNFYNSQLFALGDLPQAHPLSYWVNIFRGILGFSAGYIAYFSFLKKDRVFQLCRDYADYIFWPLFCSSSLATSICLRVSICSLSWPLLCVLHARAVGVMSTGFLGGYFSNTSGIYRIRYISGTLSWSLF